MACLFAFQSASGGEPLPTIPVVLINDAGQTTPTLTAVIDTGADGTLAPIEILERAQFRPGRQRGQLRTAEAGAPFEIVIGYPVTLRINDLELPDVYVYGSRTISEVILGRNALNQLVFTYDGPRRMLDLLSP